MKKGTARITVEQAADQMGISVARVRVLCREGRIEGAEKVGRDWVLPGQPQVVAAARQRPGKLVMKAPRKKKVKA